MIIELRKLTCFQSPIFNVEVKILVTPECIPCETVSYFFLFLTVISIPSLFFLRAKLLQFIHY